MRVIAVAPAPVDLRAWLPSVPPEWELSSWWDFDMHAFHRDGGDPYRWAADAFSALVIGELPDGGVLLPQYTLWENFTNAGKSVYAVRAQKIVVVVAARKLKAAVGNRAARLRVDDRPDLPFASMESPDMTIAQARLLLQQNFRRGVACPCCTQLVKVYKRKLNRHMVTALAHIYVFYRNGSTEWLHVPDYLTERKANPTNEVGLLRHWGLLEEATDKQRPDGAKHAGFYRLTGAGRDFVVGTVTVPKYIYLFDETLLGRSDDERISFTEAAGEKFNFAELMAET